DGGRFRFVLDSVPEGTYQIGFFHPTLDSLGITPPTRTVSVRRGDSVFVELGVPSMTTIVRAICPDNATGADKGLLLGSVRDAATDAPIGGAHVVLMWTGLSVGNTAVVKVPQAVNVPTSADGFYRACGLPADTRVMAQARVPGKQQSGWIEVKVPGNGLTLRDFLIGTRPVAVAPTTPAPGDTGAAAAPPAPLGSAVVTGTVTSNAGKPLEGAQVMLLGTRLVTRTDERGAFRLGGLPAGTQSIEIREIGYAPRRFAVDLSPHRESRLAAVLDEKAALLSAIEVTAKKGSDIPGFDERKRRGLGTYLTREDIEKRGSIRMTDVLRGLPGVQVSWDGTEYVVQMARAAGLGYSCPVQYFIDGSPFLASLDDIDQTIQPEDVDGIEVYKSASETPAEFQTGGNGGACGTIVIWTRRGGGRKR
ncbi:MAG TPA: carboxypeptidase regulatory-like domain-containing protein, partial [Gemmatimonadaceae bacterium]|nr:carboxypeptidase regulatory-like domain-containing protein [Gemmatimonadaceae bacterium]